MKKLLLSLLSVAIAMTPMGAKLKYVENSFHSTNAADVQSSATDLGRQNMTASLTKFEKSHDGDEIRGLLRISFKNLSNDDVRDKVSVSVTPGYAGKPKYINNPVDNHLECWVQVDPYDNLTLDVTVEGAGSVRIPGLDVQGENMYALEVESDETVAVTFNSSVDGTTIWLDNTILGGTAGATTIVTAEKVSLGTHRIRAKAPNGNMIDREIEVSKSNTHFPLDLSRYFQVDFRSNESDVSLYEDGKLLAALPATVKVAEGAHSYTVKKPGYDDVLHNVNIDRDGIQKFDVYKTKTIDFYSLKNNSDFSGATLYVNNEMIGNTPIAHTLPYGKYDIKMSYLGLEKRGKLTVDDKTGTTYRLALPNRGHSRFNPFGIDYHKRTAGLTLAWVQKWYKWSIDGNSESGNYLGGNSHMQGFQIGVPIQPTFAYGIGINTGLYFEGYFAKEDDISMTELCLYMPIDLMFRLPLGEEFSLFINGGIGIDWSMAMSLEMDGYDDSYDVDYGDEGSPRHFNFSAEVGGGIQYKTLQLSAQYQMGLTNNPLMTSYDEVSVKMRKLAIQLSFMF